MDDPHILDSYPDIILSNPFWKFPAFIQSHHEKQWTHKPILNTTTWLLPTGLFRWDQNNGFTWLCIQEYHIWQHITPFKSDILCMQLLLEGPPTGCTENILSYLFVTVLYIEKADSRSHISFQIMLMYCIVVRMLAFDWLIFDAAIGCVRQCLRSHNITAQVTFM